MMEVGTFWAGPIAALEKACLLSFANEGHKVTLYSFEEQFVHPSIRWASAETILESRFVSRFITNGKPNIAHFADLFRLVMFEKTANIWIDCDVVLTGDAAADWPSDLIVREGEDHVINCVLRIGSAQVLREAIGLTEALCDKDVPWAATQNIIPRAIRLADPAIPLASASEFSPFDADEWFKLLLPEHRDECEDRARHARTVHLFNNILQKVGYFKDVAPPRDSYLHGLLHAKGLLQLFSGVYPAETVRNLADGWRLRFSGEDAGFGAVTRQLLPSLRRTISRRRAR